jgi:hypothetical protein
MKPRCYFVTGTDTGVGKTQVTAALLLSAQAHGCAVWAEASGGRLRACGRATGERGCTAVAALLEPAG